MPMFTTLCTDVSEAGRKRIFSRRRIISEEVCACDNVFFTSRLINPHRDNAAYIQRFISSCRVKVILPDDALTENYKYTVLLNTALKGFNKPPDAAVYDPDGRLSFLLLKIVASCKSVQLFTNYAGYDGINDYIFSQLGTCAALCRDLYSLKHADFIISADRLPYLPNIPVLGAHNWFVNGCSPVFAGENLAECIPDYADIYSVAAGLCEICGVRRLQSAYCGSLKFKNITVPTAKVFA